MTPSPTTPLGAEPREGGVSVSTHYDPETPNRTHVPHLERWASNQMPKAGVRDLRLFQFDGTDLFQWFGKKGRDTDARDFSVFEDALTEVFAIRPRAPAAPTNGGGEPVAPESLNAEGQFFVALDHLTRMTWRWGESCGIDSVGWDEPGDSYNQSCRDDHRKAFVQVRDAFHAAIAEKAALQPHPSQQGGTEALTEFAKHTGWELSYSYGDDEGYGWCVHAVSGGVNDREWAELARAGTPLAAILAALNTSEARG